MAKLKNASTVSNPFVFELKRKQKHLSLARLINANIVIKF